MGARTMAFVALSCAALAGSCRQILGVGGVTFAGGEGGAGGFGGNGGNGGGFGGGGSSSSTSSTSSGSGTSSSGPCAMTLCGSTCVDTGTDVDNCGACGRGCSSEHVNTLMCSGGTCTPTCNAGFSNCSMPSAPSSDDGCETHTSGDPNNCGACGTVCGTDHASSAGCSNSKCTPTCDVGFGNCANSSDGCETSLSNDNNNCGKCGGECLNNFNCSNGQCGCSGEDALCTGTAAGTCNSNNLCVCNGTTCSPGQRCNAAGCGA